MVAFDARGLVVAGYDASRDGNTALLAAAREAAAREVSLAVVVVARLLHESGLSLGELVQAEKAATRQATEDIMVAMAGVRRYWPTLEAEVRVVTGVNELKGTDLATGASLLVIGRRGRAGRRALTLGSTSLELAKVVHCPVLLARDSLPRVAALPAGPVVVGLKAGALDPTLSVAAAAARLRRAPLVVIHARPDRRERSCSTDRLPRETRAAGENEGGGQDLEQSVWAWIEERLQGHGLVNGLTCRVHLVTGDPTRALLDRTTKDGLLVIGAHDRDTLTSWARGSVGSAVVERARSEVLIAR